MSKLKTITATLMLVMFAMLGSVAIPVSAQTLVPNVIATYGGMDDEHIAIDKHGNTLFVAMKSDVIAKNITFQVVDPESLEIVKDFTLGGVYFKDYPSEVLDYLREYKENSQGMVCLTQTLFNTDDKWEVPAKTKNKFL